MQKNERTAEWGVCFALKQMQPGVFLNTSIIWTCSFTLPNARLSTPSASKMRFCWQTHSDFTKETLTVVQMYISTFRLCCGVKWLCLHCHGVYKEIHVLGLLLRKSVWYFKKCFSKLLLIRVISTYYWILCINGKSFEINIYIFMSVQQLFFFFTMWQNAAILIINIYLSINTCTRLKGGYSCDLAYLSDAHPGTIFSIHPDLKDHINWTVNCS